MRDCLKSLYRFAPRFGYPKDSLMMASSSSSESVIMLDPTDGPTISPISSSSSSTSRGARSLRRVPSNRSSSEELVERESGGLKRASGKVGDEKGSSLKSADGNAAPCSSLLPSSSNPAITNGLLHCELLFSLLSFPCSLFPPSFSPFSAACFCAANRAASCRRAREGPKLRGAGGGGRMGIG